MARCTCSQFYIVPATSVIMTTLSRATGKALIKSHSGYKVVRDMVKRAVDQTNPSLVKSLEKNRVKMDSSFVDLSYCFDCYKADTLTNDKISEDVFNGEEEGVAKFQHNDKWMDDIRVEYYQLVEDSDDKLEAVTPDDTSKEDKVNLESDLKQKQEKKLLASLQNQVEMLTDSTSASLDKISTEVRNMKENGENSAKVSSLQSVLYSLDNKLDSHFNDLVNQLILLLPEHEVDEKEQTRKEYVKREKLRIDSLHLMLSTKVQAESKPSFSRSDSDKKEQTFLKKTDPPKWGGDPVEFADFVRKWKSQVSKANLPAESELDRLRESVPAQASKALFGENDMTGAWKILEGLYGDKDLIANMLKNQLKGIKGKGKMDYDIVIDLVTDVNNIVLRLKALNMEEILHVDNEFLSAVYRALPSNSQTKWLEFDKNLFRSKWAAFTKFLEVARDQALQNKVLLAGYEQKEMDNTCSNCGGVGHRPKRCPSGGGQRQGHAAVGATVASNGDTSTKQEREKQARSECGKCPLCKDRHTFYSSREQEMWPSDRLFRCDAFKNLGIKDRAATLEKFKCCPKCTSWNHQKSSCKGAIKCRNMVGNQVCGGPHSSYVCGSGSAYCGALRNPFQSVSTSDSSDLSSSDSSSDDGLSSSPPFPDLHAETLLLFQEIEINGAEHPANSCWDNGSTRCLVTHSYAKENGLKSQDIVFRLDVVGNRGDPQQGCYYLFELVQSDGSSRKLRTARVV